MGTQQQDIQNGLMRTAIAKSNMSPMNPLIVDCHQQRVWTHRTQQVAAHNINQYIT
jgi:hypothetical protein